MEENSKEFKASTKKIFEGKICADKEKISCLHDLQASDFNEQLKLCLVYETLSNYQIFAQKGSLPPCKRCSPILSKPLHKLYLDSYLEVFERKCMYKSI